jgi:hypothetical protein
MRLGKDARILTQKATDIGFRNGLSPIELAHTGDFFLPTRIPEGLRPIVDFTGKSISQFTRMPL